MDEILPLQKLTSNILPIFKFTLETISSRSAVRDIFKKDSKHMLIIITQAQGFKISNIPYGQSSAKLPVTWSLGHTRSHTWTQGHLVTRSLGNSVTWSLNCLVNWSFGHTVTWSLGHFATWSLGHWVTQSLSHSVTRSLSHSVTWSLSHSVTWSLCHYVILSFSFNNATQLTD